jgi:two-component system, NarL family, nitrate/nitrite response regulator NarL
VLHLLSVGASNKAIARELGISHLTVRLHVSSLLRIFGVTRRNEVAPKARILGALPAT